MKKIITVVALLITFTSSAFAHHMSAYDGAGVNIPDSSPHLLMVF